jgi:hypothetical protein
MADAGRFEEEYDSIEAQMAEEIQAAATEEG